MPRVYHRDSGDLSVSEDSDISDSLSYDSSDEDRRIKKRPVKKKSPRKVNNTNRSRKSTPLKRKVPNKKSNAPKKPLTPYMRYRNANIATVKQQNPTLGARDITILLSNNWKSLSAEDKEVNDFSPQYR
jgi:high mobility group protein B1